MNRRDEIDFELRQLRRLENRLTDAAKIREDIKALVAKLEAEKEALPSDEE